MKSRFKQLIGVQSHSSASEKALATIGAGLGITLMYVLTAWITDTQGALAVLPSMGAAAVLLFAVPHGPLSQPWALIMGNGLSAAVGVSCAILIDNNIIAAGVAVGLSVLVMHLARAIHPPGGATALAAVIGGPSIQALGYGYVLAPTLLNCFILLVVALLFNNQFAWRRYPAERMRYKVAPKDSLQLNNIQERHIEKVLDDLDVMVDVSAQQIKVIVDKAQLLLRDERIEYLHVELGAFYTNAKLGATWSVRQIIDERQHADPRKHILVYKIVEGNGRSAVGSCSLEEFSEWAKECMSPASKGRVKKAS